MRGGRKPALRSGRASEQPREGEDRHRHRATLSLYPTGEGEEEKAGAVWGEGSALCGGRAMGRGYWRRRRKATATRLIPRRGEVEKNRRHAGGEPLHPVAEQRENRAGKDWRRHKATAPPSPLSRKRRGMEGLCGGEGLALHSGRAVRQSGQGFIGGDAAGRPPCRPPAEGR